MVTIRLFIQESKRLEEIMAGVEGSSWRKCGYFGKIVISGTILSDAPSLVFDSLPEEFLLIAFIVSSDFLMLSSSLS